MQNNHPIPVVYIRYAHEFLFSLNVALVAKLEGNQEPNRLFSFFDSGEISLQSKINGFLHLHPHHAVGANTAFLILALGMALCIFLVLRIASRTRVTEQLVRTAAGIVSLLVLPIAWLSVTNLLGAASGLPNPSHPLLWLELLIVTVCAVLYLDARWPFPQWFGLLLLAVHFGFWNWIVSGGQYFWRDPFRLAFPLAGFAATVLWALYVANSRRAALSE